MTKDTQEKFYRMLGEKIRDARKAAELKQETLASLLGLSRVSIVNIEKGRQHPPLHLLCDISKILKVDIVSLIPDTPTPENTSKVNWDEIIYERLKGNKKASNILREFVQDIKQTK